MFFRRPPTGALGALACESPPVRQEAAEDRSMPSLGKDAWFMTTAASNPLTGMPSRPGSARGSSVPAAPYPKGPWRRMVWAWRSGLVANGSSGMPSSSARGSGPRAVALTRSSLAAVKECSVAAKAPRRKEGTKGKAPEHRKEGTSSASLMLVSVTKLRTQSLSSCTSNLDQSFLARPKIVPFSPMFLRPMMRTLSPA